MPAIHIDIGKRKRIWLRAPYSPRVNKILGKNGLGASFIKAEEVWSLPLDFVTCQQLRKAFGADLEIGPALWLWATQERKKRDEVGSIHAGGLDAPAPIERVRVEAPTVYAAMQERGYQTHAPRFAATVGSFFLADQPGLGKTLMLFGALVERGIRGRILVLAPQKALRATWQTEIEKWMAPDFTVGLTIADTEMGNLQDRNQEIATMLYELDGCIDFNFILCNPEMARVQPICPKGNCRGNKFDCEYKSEHTTKALTPALFAKPWDAIVLDETHKYLMNANERSQSVSQVGFGIQKLPLREGGLKVGMSGTPFKGKPLKFWSTLHWLRPDKYTGRWRWAKQYFEVEPDQFAFDGQKVTDTLREDMRDAFNAELGLIMMRRTKSELHAINPEWIPPDKQYVEVRVQMGTKQAKAYREIRDEAEAQLAGGLLTANGTLAELTRLKQLAGAHGRMSAGRFLPSLPSCKWDWIKNIFLAERGILDNDGFSKVVIAGQFVQVLELYLEELRRMKIPAYIITGKTTKVDSLQRAWQSDYQDGDPRVLLLSTKAGGVSLTLDEADDMVINDETFVSDEQEQLEDRIHRTGRTDHQVTIYRLVTEGTIDEQIADTNLTLDEIQKEILDGRRGVPFAKRLLQEGRK